MSLAFLGWQLVACISEIHPLLQLLCWPFPFGWLLALFVSGGGCCWSPCPVICILARMMRNVLCFAVTVGGNMLLGPVQLVALPLFGLVLSPLKVVCSPLDVVFSPLEVVRPPLECE